MHVVWKVKHMTLKKGLFVSCGFYMWLVDLEMAYSRYRVQNIICWPWYAFTVFLVAIHTTLKVINVSKDSIKFIRTSFLVLRNLNVFRLPAFCLCNLFALAWSDATPMASLLPTDAGAMLVTPPPMSESTTSTNYYSEKYIEIYIHIQVIIIFVLWIINILPNYYLLCLPVWVLSLTVCRRWRRFRISTVFLRYNLGSDEAAGDLEIWRFPGTRKNKFRSIKYIWTYI